MNIRLNYVVPRQKLAFYNLVSTRCLFLHLDYLIGKVCQSEPNKGGWFHYLFNGREKEGKKTPFVNKEEFQK